jgi:hypothetical protein
LAAAQAQLRAASREYAANRNCRRPLPRLSTPPPSSIVIEWKRQETSSLVRRKNGLQRPPFVTKYGGPVH